MATVNLGQIQAIVVQPTEPTSANHKQMLWFDTNYSVLKYFDHGAGVWREVSKSILKFIELQDTPAAYPAVNPQDYIAQVNSAGDGVEFTNVINGGSF